MSVDPVVIEKRPRSLVHMFLQRVEDAPDEDAFYYPVEAGWQESSWAATHELVQGLAAGLVALGLEPEDRVAILARTRYEWVLGFLATLWAGGAVTSLDPDTEEEALAEVLADSGARVVLAEDYDVVHRLWRVRGRIRDVLKVVQIDGDYPDGRVLTLEGLLALGHEHLQKHPRALSQRLYAVRRRGLAALLYVDDPRGGVRGVRLSHAALTYQASAVAALGGAGPADLVYAALPMWTAYAQAVLAIQLACGFPLALEGRPEHEVESLATVRPTVVAATPRLLRMVRGSIEDAQRRGLVRGRRSVQKRVRAGAEVALGDRLRVVVCAGRGLDADLADFFEEAGVVVLEAYGLAETAGAVSIGALGEAANRTAGRPLPGSEVRIGQDGQIEVAGPGVMEGYHRRPADTAEALVHGWLRTGDAGVVDPEGRLLVLGRHVVDGR